MLKTSHRALARPGLRAAFTLGLSLGLAGQPAQALTRVDELTFFITSASFRPGDVLSTRLTFATRPGIALSAFSFALLWSTPLAGAVATGSGSIQEWGSALGQRGQFELLSAAPQAITGSWRAHSLAPSADVIPIPYEQPMLADFAFQTSATLNDSFVVSIQLYDIADGQGETVDTGSGFINWATMAPVPEPATAILLLLGIAGLAGRSARPA